ncbi:MAG: tetratricopeptide repeat protein, partial [Oscillochloris sp.]|nr:tetratricopeptide repeat protein [Oscillochloris sp.]
PDTNAQVQDLLNLHGTEAVVAFIKRSSPLRMMSYAEVVLLQAHELNPLNKDHFANLGRLNNYWYGLTGDPERLRLAIKWYEQVAPIAPHDVTLINERAGVVASLGDYALSVGDSALAKAQYEQAAELLRHSEELDPRYADTYLRIGNLARIQDDLTGATDSYVKAIDLSATMMVNEIQTIANDLVTHPDLITRLYDAFVVAAQKSEERLAAVEGNPESTADAQTIRSQAALLHSAVGLLAVRAGKGGDSLESYRRAVALQPTNAEYSRNYTIVLSETQHYTEAIAEANRMIATLQSVGQTDQVSQAQQLLEVVQHAQYQH